MPYQDVTPDPDYYAELCRAVQGFIDDLRSVSEQLNTVKKTVPLCDSVWTGYAVDIDWARRDIENAARQLSKLLLNPPPRTTTAATTSGGN